MGQKDISRYLRDSNGNSFSSDNELRNLANNSIVKNINSGLTFKKVGATVFDKVPIEIETDAVLYTAQTLTDAQKLQARTNIGVSDLSGVPLGTIVIWTRTTIPTGWSICNGQNGTPDLRGKFVLGAGGVYPLNSTGGSVDHYHYIGYHTGDNSGCFYVNGELHNDSEHTNGVQNPKAPTKSALLSAINFNDNSPVYVKSEIGPKTAGWNGSGGGGISDHSKLTAGNLITSRGYGAVAEADCLPPYYALYYIMKTSGNDSTASGGTAASASQVENLSNLISQLQARIASLEASGGGTSSSGGGTFTLGNEFTATLVSEGARDDPIPAGTIITPNLYTQGDGQTYGGSSSVLGRWYIYQGAYTTDASQKNRLTTGSYVVTQQGTVSSKQSGSGSPPYYTNIHTLKLRRITGVNISGSSDSSSSGTWGTTLFETVSGSTNGSIVKTINQPVPEGTIVKLFSVTQFSTGSDSSGNGSGIPIETKRFYVWKANGYTLTNEDKTTINNLTSRYNSPYRVTYDSGTI